MPDEKEKEVQPAPASSADSASTTPNAQTEPIEPYEPPELVKFERLGKLIVSGE